MSKIEKNFRNRPVKLKTNFAGKQTCENLSCEVVDLIMNEGKLINRYLIDVSFWGEIVNQESCASMKGPG